MDGDSKRQSAQLTEPRRSSDTLFEQMSRAQSAKSAGYDALNSLFICVRISSVDPILTNDMSCAQWQLV